MADTIKILGQANLAATTLTDIYTVPASTSTVVSSICFCNTGGTQTTFRLSFAIAGAADAIKQYIYYDLTIPANDTFTFTGGVSMATTDKIRG